MPVQPYAFVATPTLTNGGQVQFGAFRTNSSPNVPTTQNRYYANASMTNLPSSVSQPMAMNQRMSRDDLSLPSMGGQLSRPQQPTGQPTFAQVAGAKASPDRYRRPSPRHVDSFPSSQQSQGLGMATVVHFHNPRAAMGERKISNPRASRPHSAYGYLPGAAADDMLVQGRPMDDETRQRFRRRSMHSFDPADYPQPLTPQELKQQQKQAEESFRTERKNSNSDRDQRIGGRLAPTSVAHTRNGSSESLASSRSSNSRPSSANRNSNASAPTASPASTTAQSDEKSNSEPSKLNVPARSSSSDAGKRVLSPSPLSKPMNMASESSTDDTATPTVLPPSPTKPPGSSHGSIADSPAAKQLAAINEKGGRPKSKTSRLRRAFSFGSAAELKKVTTPETLEKTPGQNEPSKLHKEPRANDLYEEEQARIAQKQEESGLGNNIYSGTKIFAGSTDNLSISSTASSASIMLRKMGKGMKKGGRSLVGLFRPKSMIGSSSRDKSAPEASQATVSMITVEAERERVNVNSNADLSQKPATGFPHLERNSMDAMDDAHTDSLRSDRLDSSGTETSGARKSIVGGEKERAEVLATIRKGILKTRSNSPSPAPRGQDGKGTNFELPMIPNVSDSPSSSAPSTPNEDAQGHKRTGSVAIGSEDYFMSALRLRQDNNTKSAPGTPQGSVSKRNATFSPRIVFYDTWPSQEYDRRGDIATCNRLTPMLAQQIKEELNSFKMEMEVHETSKIYTHFF